MRTRMSGPSSVGGVAQGFDDALGTSLLVSTGPIGITTRASRMRREIVVRGIRTRPYLLLPGPQVGLGVRCLAKQVATERLRAAPAPLVLFFLLLTRLPLHEEAPGSGGLPPAE
jgi:hypothetical protein